MNAFTPAWPVSPAIVLRRFVRSGLLAALAFALAADAQLFEASKDCRGSFSRDFSNGFDLYRCDLVVRKIGSEFEIRVPLPQ
jgi:hypothetical protein